MQSQRLGLLAGVDPGLQNEMRGEGGEELRGLVSQTQNLTGEDLSVVCIGGWFLRQ